MALISYTETLVALDIKYEDEEHGIMGDFFVNHPELGSVIQTQIIALDAEYSASVRKRRVEQEQCIARLGLDNLDGIASVFARVQKEIDNLRGRHHSSCLLYTSTSPRDPKTSRMPSSA